MRTRSARLVLVLASALVLASTARAAERGADGRFETRRSRHFLLLQDVAIDRYTGPQGSRRFERDVLAVLEQAWDDVDDTLGITPRGLTRVVVYDGSVYDRDFSQLFGFRSAGFFDGSIHVRAGTRVDRALASTLQHEYVHAALAGLPLPAWLGEGVAEYFERSLGERGPTPGERRVLARIAASGAWIPLAELSGPSFAGLDATAAAIAYLESLAFVDHLVRRGGERTLGRLCRELARSDLERALRRRYGLSSESLEREVLMTLGAGD